jgi:hypothetical protein
MAAAKGDDKGGKGDDKLPRVEMIGIESIDAVFKRLDRLDKKVRDAEREVNTSQRNLNKALGIKNDQPIQKALDNLQKRAEGKVKVATKGGPPRLEPTDAVPANIQQAIDAVNAMVKSFIAAIDDLKDVPKLSKALIDECKALPNSLRAEVASGPGGFIGVIFELPKALKAVTNNIKVASSLPKRTVTVTTKMANVVGTVTNEFQPLVAR